MAKLHYGSETTYCPKCQDRASRQDWTPPEGFDPHLVKFKCRKCKFEFYTAEADETPTAAAKFI